MAHTLDRLPIERVRITRGTREAALRARAETYSRKLQALPDGPPPDRDSASTRLHVKHAPQASLAFDPALVRRNKPCQRRGSGKYLAVTANEQAQQVIATAPIPNVNPDTSISGRRFHAVPESPWPNTQVHQGFRRCVAQGAAQGERRFVRHLPTSKEFPGKGALHAQRG